MQGNSRKRVLPRAIVLGLVLVAAAFWWGRYSAPQTAPGRFSLLENLEAGELSTFKDTDLQGGHHFVTISPEGSVLFIWTITQKDNPKGSTKITEYSVDQVNALAGTVTTKKLQSAVR